MTKKQIENINHEMWLAMDAVETWTKRANDTKMEDRKKDYTLFSTQALNRAVGISNTMKILGYIWKASGIGQFGEFIKE
jgi:hypothetical protein